MLKASMFLTRKRCCHRSSFGCKQKSGWSKVFWRLLRDWHRVGCSCLEQQDCHIVVLYISISPSRDLQM